MNECSYCGKEFDDTLYKCPYCGSTKTGVEIYKNHPNDLKIGTLLDGRYSVGKRLNCGGFGVVYKGASIKSNKVVAIKEFFPSGSNRDKDNKVIYSRDYTVNEIKKFHKRFKEESEVVKNEKCMIFPEIYDFVVSNNTCYIIMEYVNGITLKKILEKEKNIKLNEVLRLIHPVLKGLKILHSLNFLHRDIKPENIIKNIDGRVQIIDFGASRKYEESKEVKMTCYLTPSYAPLEQHIDTGNFGPSLDIYSVGATMYHLLTGSIPIEAIQRKVKDDEYLELNKKYGLDQKIEKIINRCMCIDSKKRYQSIDELINALSIFNDFKNLNNYNISKKLKLIYEKKDLVFEEEIYKSTIIGRSTEDYFPDLDVSNIQTDGTISRKHARIFFEKKEDLFEWYIEDLKSKNGTFLNGNKINNKIIICNNDILKFGINGKEFKILL